MSSISPTVVFYVNGILNDGEEGGKQAVEKLQKIVRKLKNVTIEHHYNDAFDQTQAMKALLRLATFHLIKSTLLPNMDIDNTRIALFGNEERKKVCADQLAIKVKNYLETDESKKAILVLHSQGAHVGYLALDQLKHLKDRIKVISIGGMVEIPSSMAKDVINIQNLADGISIVVPYFQNQHCKGEKGKVLPINKSYGTEAHFVLTYIKRRVFKLELRDFIKMWERDSQSSESEEEKTLSTTQKTIEFLAANFSGVCS